MWNPQLSKCVYQTAEVHAKYSADVQESVRDKEKTNTLDDSQNIVQMLYNKEINGIAVVTYDQNISIIGLDKLRLKKQVSDTLFLHLKAVIYMSRVMRKPTFCIYKNKDADQLRGHRKADQGLCFCYIDGTIPLLAKSKISSP